VATRLGLVDQSELARWADSREAQGDLPRLIRRLILETGRGVEQLDFPGGEGISTGGWDGTVRATEATAFIPAGLSLWEVSTDKNANKKADRDYAKRLTTPDGSPTEDCTYVAVSLRPWKKRHEWATEKTAGRRWKAVLAYGLDKLETWLESAPVTHAWLSERLGFDPHGLLAVETWWASWSGTTKPPFPAAAVLAGREGEAAALRADLARPGRIITVQASSRDDVIAFVSALVLRDAEEGGGALLARSALVDKVEAWRRLRDHRAPLLLVPRAAEVVEDLGGASAHHLIVPVVGAGPADFTLPPIDSQKAKEALEAAGLPERQANETGQLARLSLLAARRRIASKPELHRPPWATTPIPRLIRRALLAGRWKESSEADLAVVSSIFGAGYDSKRDELESLISAHDPLLVRLDSSVGLVSEFDAWLLLSTQLRKEDLESFQAAALAVFDEADPALELPPEQRSMAAVLGKVRAHSGDLRHGLAITLALLGSHGDAVVAGSGLTGKDWAVWTVRRIFETANKDETCALWASLEDVLTLLAEAAPSTFLDAVRDGLNGERPLLQRLFTDSREASSIWPDSAHTGLLWALETCAWSPTDFGQSVDLLARLAEVDPGGRLLKRPAASLKGILRPSYPQTSVSSASRLAAIDGLRERHEPVAWRLMLAMLPRHRSILDFAVEPRFRDWKPRELSVTQQERRSFIEELYRRLLADVGTDSARWISVIAELQNLPPQVRTSALEQLKALSANESLEDSARDEIWKAVRSRVSEHHRFAKATWALPADEIDQLEEIGKKFEPSVPSKRLAWLFNEDMPEIPNYHQDGDEYESALSELRAKAAAEVAASLDWPQLHAFAINAKEPWYFGTALARAGVADCDSPLIKLLRSAESAERDFAAGYLSQRFRTENWPWVERNLREGNLSPEEAGRLLLVTHDFPKAWEVAEAAGEDIATAFWSHFPTRGLGSDFSHVETAAQRLLDAGRPGSALALLALYLHKGSGTLRAELMATGLERLAQLDPADPETSTLSNHKLMSIFSHLGHSAVPTERLARLEWAYLLAFDYDSSPPTLCRHLAQDPSFFVEVISRVYPETLRENAEPCGKMEAEPGEAERAIARNAYQLLSRWRTLPGKREDGTLDGELLNQWVNVARRLLREARRLDAGDDHIGAMLALSPADPDGTWPCVEVRNLLETLQSTDIENGLQRQICNDRGATSRSMLDGGDQERDLVAKYREQAEQFADRWPRTAAILRNLADTYEHWARYFEADAERRRTGFER